MQLELARNAGKAGSLAPVMQFVGAAHEIVRRSLASARESIWDMRSHILESRDLVGALRTVAEQLRGGMDCAITVRVEGRPRRLAPALENNLLRIGQEAVSNALKHARPRLIELEFFFAPEGVRLVVSDDGPGFDPAAAEPASSHFGLRGMRERMAKINGTLNVGRREGGGGGSRFASKPPNRLEYPGQNWVPHEQEKRSCNPRDAGGGPSHVPDGTRGVD